MYLNELKFTALRRLADGTISFQNPDGTPRMWTVFIGENGTCKTTLLRAIALLGAGVSTANQLVSGGLTRSLLAIHRRTPMHLEAQFSFSEQFHGNREYPGFDHKPERPPRLRSALTLTKDDRIFEGKALWVDHPTLKDPLEQARRRKNHPYWFMAAYGVDRQLPMSNTDSNSDDPVLDRTRSLFDQRRLKGTAFVNPQKISALEIFEEILNLALTKSADLVPDLQAIKLLEPGSKRAPKKAAEKQTATMKMGQKNRSLPLTWLSAGYQSTVAWLSDLIGLILTDAEFLKTHPQQMEAIVLIDEIDLHLHPRWQVGIIEALRETFPRIQFIATTHSPMVIPGLKPHEIIDLEIGEDGNIRATQALDRPTKARTGGELYRDFFGLGELYPTDVAEAVYEQGRLACDAYRSDEEDQRLQELTAELEAQGAAPIVPVRRRQRP